MLYMSTLHIDIKKYTDVISSSTLIFADLIIITNRRFYHH